MYNGRPFQALDVRLSTHPALGDMQAGLRHGSYGGTEPFAAPLPTAIEPLGALASNYARRRREGCVPACIAPIPSLVSAPHCCIRNSDVSRVS